MQFSLIFLTFTSAVSANIDPRKPQITSAPAQPRDFIGDVAGDLSEVESGFDSLTDAAGSVYSSAAAGASEIMSITFASASESSTLATATDASSVAAAASASASVAGAGVPVQTVAVGLGALMGALAILANI